MSSAPTAREAVTPDRHDRPAQHERPARPVRVRHQARDAALLMTTSLLMALVAACGFLLLAVLLAGPGR